MWLSHVVILVSVLVLVSLMGGIRERDEIEELQTSYYNIKTLLRYTYTPMSLHAACVITKNSY